MDEVEKAVVIIARLVSVNYTDWPLRPARAYRSSGVPYHVDRRSPVSAAHVSQGEGTRGGRVRHASDGIEHERRRAVDYVFAALGGGRIVTAAPHGDVYER
jgi:hypothetical protein